MGKKGFAAKLPKELHTELDRMIAEGDVSVDQVRAWLAERGVEVGRSSVHRHMQSVEDVAAEMREAREVAAAVVQQLGPEAAEGQVGRLLIQVVQNIAFKMAREQLGGPDLDMEELMFLASTVQKLSSAEKTDADRISKLKMEALKEAAASTDKLGKTLGWSADTARQVRANILGVSLGEGGVIAALYVEAGGCYFGRPDIDAYDVARDARLYTGPWPVVAHPPCERWGRFWHGSPRKPHQFRRGEDGGCFAAAVTSARNYGGLVEHPAGSSAFAFFGLPIPQKGAGWSEPDCYGGRSCYVEQGHYGHSARKATWLYAVLRFYPELNWSAGEQQLPQWMVDRYGYERARKFGIISMLGGKDKTKKRNATPLPFRDLLLSMATGAMDQSEAA